MQFLSRGVENADAKKLFDRWFPTPVFLAPPSLGIDISDNSIKWLALEAKNNQRQVRVCGEELLPNGVVVGGIVKNPDALAESLRTAKARFGGIVHAHAALPEEASYVFSMHVPTGTQREQVLRMIEFEFEGRVPILPSAAVYDYDVIIEHDNDEGTEIAVVVFPLELAQAYAAAFKAAGIVLLSLELEARSIARAISTRNETEPITLLVDFGRAHTGFAVLKRGIPIFTSSIEIGGESMTQTLMSKFSMSAEEAEHFKNTEGIARVVAGNEAKRDVVMSVAAALASEVARHYHYWDTRRNEHGDRVTPVGQVLFVGGSSNLHGLSDYIAERVQAVTRQGDVWRHVASFDSYIPPVDRATSMQYATVVGLALREF